MTPGQGTGAPVAPESTAASAIGAASLEGALHVGAEACAGCHAAEADAWKHSHHALAMQIAGEETVRGDFNDARFEYAGVTTRFFRRDGEFFVNTDGADGTPQDYEVVYTFGVMPLQQYLIAFPGGRYQALSIAWDTRAREQGGQRWFHLYPNERITHGDELHWTGLQQNWNAMCADCHSTNLRKGYDAAHDTYETTWSEINVSCEACHGAGSRHVAWAREGRSRDDRTKGLTVALDERHGVRWSVDAVSGNATRSPPRTSGREIEVCAQCHARRGQMTSGYAPGKPFLDHYLPALLTAPLYYADGQQRDEVYTWGSFMQSKMYARGVTCGDCHEPHGGTLRADGNVLCASCHLPAKYDAREHHHHASGGAGARCVACHMPTATYMVVDPRHDHGFRVPRPDVSVALGTPNACTQCHSERPAAWAVEQVAKWYGHAPAGFQNFAPALDASMRGAADATTRLAGLLDDPEQPDIVRATAATALARTPDPAGFAAAMRALRDRSALVRRGALETMAALTPERRLTVVAPLLADPVRVVRIEAANLLASLPSSAFSVVQRAAFERAAGDYETVQRFSADRPEHRTNLGSYYAQRGRSAEAEAELRAALALWSGYVPAWANLADLERALGRDAEAEAVLRSGLAARPADPSLTHALGLALVRLQRKNEALKVLAEAARLAPHDAHFAYVYAVALHDTGQSRVALETLSRALARHPTDRELLYAAATMHRDAGDAAQALAYARRLAAQSPWDASARQLVDELGARAAEPR